MKAKYLFIIGSLILLGTLFISCDQAGAAEVEKEDDIELGEVSFQVTGLPEAQEHFKNGLLFLHSFEYEAASAEFELAREKDKSMAMAYWGEAMTCNHSIWQRQKKEKALQILSEFAATPEERAAKIKTDLEKDFFAAIEILFGEGTKYDRDIAYQKYLEKMTKKYPGHHEVSAFYAISLLASSRNGRDAKLYDKSARIAQGILKENPQHPGALHYLIHSYDDPDHAHMAVDAADSYAKVAPDAAHALHMPSHIYVALGRWNDVVTSNIASWNASMKKAKTDEAKNGSYHALNWLQYGFLQRGELDMANKMLQKMVNYTDENPSKSARSYMVAMKGAQMVETDAWEGLLADIEIHTMDLNLVKRAGYSYLEGMKAYHQQDQKELNRIIDQLAIERIAATHELGDEQFAMCSTGGFANKPPSQMDVDMVQILEYQLQANLADLNGDVDEAKDLFEKATKLDEYLEYSYGPPLMLKPVHEAYAEYLAKQKDWKASHEMFEKSLERQPRRMRSLQGKLKVSQELNNQKSMAEVQEEINLSTTEKARNAIL